MDRENKENFGYDLSNPILTTSIPDTYAYLSELITDDGDEIGYERTGSYVSKNIITKDVFGNDTNALCDGFIIFNHKREEIAKLYFCSYFTERSSSAPAGFKLRTSEKIQNKDINDVNLVQIVNSKNDDELMQTLKEIVEEDTGGSVPEDFDISKFREQINKSSQSKTVAASRKVEAENHNLKMPNVKTNWKTVEPEWRSNDGCFIATACVGNHNDKILVGLRDFRDQWIRQKAWGESFIKIYYKYGKIVARKIENNFLLRKIFLYLLVIPVFNVSRFILFVNQNKD